MTSLANGVRVSKSDLRLETYGFADELNAQFGWLGALLSKLCTEIPLDEPLNDVTVHCAQVATIQNKLFNLGAMLSCAPGQWITEEDVKRFLYDVNLSHLYVASDNDQNEKEND